MGRLALRRIAAALFLAWVVATLLFVLVRTVPGDPVDVLVPPETTLEVRERLREQYGLDRSLGRQYLDWMGSLAQGDWGVSFRRGRPVTAVLADALPDTLLLGGAGLFLAFLIGLPLGVAQARRPGTLFDRAASAASLFFYSMPAFWLAIVLVLLFSLTASSAGWPIRFPASGVISSEYVDLTGWERLVDRFRHLVLPAASIGLVLAGGLARYTRTAMREALRSEAVTAARAWGLSERAVLWRHAFPLAATPLITLLGLQLPLLIGGTVLVETVFSWPGMGRLLVDAVLQRDYPLVVGGALVFSIGVVLANLVADLLQGWLDPRTLERSGGHPRAGSPILPPDEPSAVGEGGRR